MGKRTITHIVSVLLIVAFASAGLAVLYDPGCSDCECLYDCALCPACCDAIVSHAALVPDSTGCGLVSADLFSPYSLAESVVLPPPRV